MICQHCGKKILRSPRDDYRVQANSLGCENSSQEAEAWTDGTYVVCQGPLRGDDRRLWHEPPLPIPLEEIVADLQFIESDLR